MKESLDHRLSLRLMSEEDFPRCQWLREQVGWNQTLEDWKRFLGYDPTGCFVAEMEGVVVGTVCTIPYEEEFGWVAMVIVDPEQRRKGMGTLLLKRGIAHLEEQGLTVKLDATPAGKLLYDTLGFEDEYGVARYEVDVVEVKKPEAECETLSHADLEALDLFDRPIFGASREPVLRSYMDFYPDLAYVLREGEEIVGYIMAREGVHAFHVGPWVAREERTARNLLYTLLYRRRPGRVFVDIVEPNAYVLPMLEGLGFRLQRPFIRMYKGENTHPGKPEWIYGISGPELG